MRVLVIEDEPDLLHGIAQALREERYAVDEAADGTDGHFKAVNWEYDAIVLDVMLPGMNGFDLLKSLRTKKKTPVLMLTARDAIPDRVRGLDVGADDYLVKPFDLNELLARLRALIRRSAGQATPLIEIGPITIDVRARSVKLEGQPVALTAREYAIVEFLALRRGQVVSRTEIYDHIFDENDDSLSNLLDVHVGHVRRKLGKDFISTRRGQGYVIDAAD
ncbi:MAG: response regulator transcription factor [Gemmataceae bacterium]